MTLWTRTSALALATALLANPVLAQSSGDVVGKGPPTVATEVQQANPLPGEPQVAGIDAAWHSRDNYISAADEAVDFWKDKVADLDPGTERVEPLKERLESLESQHESLQQADAGAWETEREEFGKTLLVVREMYSELPQSRKSDAAEQSPAAVSGAPPANVTD